MERAEKKESKKMKAIERETTKLERKLESAEKRNNKDKSIEHIRPKKRPQKMSILGVLLLLLRAVLFYTLPINILGYITTLLVFQIDEVKEVVLQPAAWMDRTPFISEPERRVAKWVQENAPWIPEISRRLRISTDFNLHEVVTFLILNALISLILYPVIRLPFTIFPFNKFPLTRPFSIYLRKMSYLPKKRN